MNISWSTFLMVLDSRFVWWRGWEDLCAVVQVINELGVCMIICLFRGAVR